MNIQTGQVQKNISIPYSKDEIIAAFDKVQERSKFLHYKTNLSFGMIEFNIINGINPFKVSISLSETETNKCSAEILLSRSSGSKVDSNVMQSVFMDLMNVVDKQLKGETITDAEIKKGKGGCMVFVPLILAMTAAAVYLLMVII